MWELPFHECHAFSRYALFLGQEGNYPKTHASNNNHCWSTHLDVLSDVQHDMLIFLRIFTTVVVSVCFFQRFLSFTQQEGARVLSDKKGIASNLLVLAPCGGLFSAHVSSHSGQQISHSNKWDATHTCYGTVEFWIP